MKKQMFIMLAVAALLFGSLFGWKAWVGFQMAQSMQSMGMPPVTVSTAPVKSARWTPTIPAVGSLRALQGVNITPQLEGMITAIHFESGQQVKAGELLIEQYSADDTAQLQGLLADTHLAELNFKRAEELLPQKLISEFEFDTRQTDLQRARAAENSLRLSIAQKSIRAPFSGQLGLRQVDLGQHIEPGDTVVRLEALTQMLVDFPVPQRYIGEIYIDQPLSLTVDSWPGETFPAIIRAIEPQINRDTRALRIQAVVDNPDSRLLPGMFAQVEIQLAIQDDVITVPQAAISYSPHGDSVYVVDPATTGESVRSVQSRVVETGLTRGDQVAILTGLTEGMEVVTAGQQKLRNGSQVLIDNSVSVSNVAEPMPANN